MPVIELVLALPMIVWGGVVWTWMQTRSAAVKFWATAGSFIITLASVAAVAAMDEGTRTFVHNVLN